MTTQSTFDYVPDEPVEKSVTPETATESVQEVIPPSTGVALVIPSDQEIAAMFSREGGLEPYIDHIKKWVESEFMDETTEEGRARAGSVARQVGTMKVKAEAAADKLTEGWKASTKAVTTEKSRMSKAMDAIRDKVLAPREAFKAREEARVNAHKQRLDALSALTAFPDPDHPPTSTAVQVRISQLTDFNDIQWQEFTDSAKAAREKVEAQLSDMLVKTKKAEDDAAELIKFRAAEDSRNRAYDAMHAEAYTDNVAFDAAAKAKKDAEDEAERQRIADKAALDKALQDALDLAAAEKKRTDDATAKRNADTAHKAKINNAAVAVLADVIGAETQQLCEEFAKEVVIAIASGKIPNVTITY